MDATCGVEGGRYRGMVVLNSAWRAGPSSHKRAVEYGCQETKHGQGMQLGRRNP